MTRLRCTCASPSAPVWKGSTLPRPRWRPPTRPAGRRSASCSCAGSTSAGFVFFTNYDSRKGRDLIGQPARGAVPALADAGGTGAGGRPGRAHRRCGIGRVLRRPAARQPARRLGVGPEQRARSAIGPRRPLEGRRAAVPRPAGSAAASLGRDPDRPGADRILVRPHRPPSRPAAVHERQPALGRPAGCSPSAAG